MILKRPEYRTFNHEVLKVDTQSKSVTIRKIIAMKSLKINMTS